MKHDEKKIDMVREISYETAKELGLIPTAKNPHLHNSHWEHRDRELQRAEQNRIDEKFITNEELMLCEFREEDIIKAINQE